MFIYNAGASAVSWVWATTPPPKKTPQEVIAQLRTSISSGDENLFLSEQIDSLFKDKTYDFLKSAIEDLVSKLNSKEDLVLLQHLLNFIDKLPISIETDDAEFDTDVSEFKTQIEELLRSRKDNQPLDVDGQPGDKEFCLQLENSEDLTEALNAASLPQVKSALVYFSLPNSALQEQFIPFMHALIQCTKSREIPLNFKSNRSSILALLTRKISEYPCSDRQIALLGLLLNDDTP